MSINRLFTVAAKHAARFRSSVPWLAHAPSRNYEDSVQEFSEPLPSLISNMDTVLEALVHKAEPGLNLMTGPRFFAWVIGGSHPMGVAADFLTSAWGQNAGNHTASPSAAAAEKVAADWLLELLRLPAESSVGFVTGATMASFTCLAAARGEILRQAGWDPDAKGLFGAPEITVVTGDDAHATLFSALQYLGLGYERVVKVATDDQGRISVADFEKTMAAVEGPCILMLQAGQVNTGAFDDFSALVPIAKSRGAWVHVDGAFGLWAQVSEKRRHLAAGIELADSWSTDGHKWLQTPYDSGFAIVKNELAHRRAMTISASYLPAAVEGQRDPSHYVPELSRRARGFPVWAMIKHLGKLGIEDLIDDSCDCAVSVGRGLSHEPGISILNDIVLNQVLVRFGDDLPIEAGDRLTDATVQALQRGGTIYVGGASWRGRKVMRLSVSNYLTDAREVAKSVEAIVAAYRHARAALPVA